MPKFHWLVVSLCLIPVPGTAQSSTLKASKYDVESHLRQELKKLRRWGIDKLLRTERAVDIQQRKRANYSTNPEELTLLADDEDGEVRFYVASNKHTPLGIKMRLVGDPLPFVRSGVALAIKWDPLDSPNVKNITDMIIQELAKDPQPIVRMSLAGNLNLSPSAYETLAQDPDYIIRQKVAKNTHLPKSALNILVQDTVEVVQVQALKHRNIDISWLRNMSGDQSPIVRLAIGQNTNTPATILGQLGLDSEPSIRLAVAQHKNTAQQTLELLAEDDDITVLMAVTDHVKTDRTMLMNLAFNSSDADVRMLAKKRLEPFLREEIQDDILERWKAE
tara:strand:- start:1704 stop:2705 length:1002 start_codon:yes stop_codon:yes gene_type:complete